VQLIPFLLDLLTDFWLGMGVASNAYAQLGSLPLATERWVVCQFRLASNAHVQFLFRSLKFWKYYNTEEIYRDPLFLQAKPACFNEHFDPESPRPSSFTRNPAKIRTK